MIEEALFDYLSGVPGLAALVDDRIYPFRLPEKAVLPAIAWQRISAQRIYTFDTFEDTAAWVRARFQLACWARKPFEALQVAEQVVAALSGFEGNMAGQQVGSVTVELEFDSFESETKFFRRLVDVFISYEEQLTTTS